MLELPSLQLVPFGSGAPATQTWFEQTIDPVQTLPEVGQSEFTSHCPGVPAQIPVALQTSPKVEAFPSLQLVPTSGAGSP